MLFTKRVKSFLCRAIGLKVKLGFNDALSRTDLFIKGESFDKEMPNTVNLPFSNSRSSVKAAWLTNLSISKVAKCVGEMSVSIPSSL